MAFLVVDPELTLLDRAPSTNQLTYAIATTARKQVGQPSSKTHDGSMAQTATHVRPAASRTDYILRAGSDQQHTYIVVVEAEGRVGLQTDIFSTHWAGTEPMAIPAQPRFTQSYLSLAFDRTPCDSSATVSCNE